MRIISGTCRGKKLFTPKDENIRPTADRAREAIYNILYTKLEKPLSEYSVLDIYSGTGAFGLEAASRGAKSVTFVDIDLTLTKKNSTHCGFKNVSFIKKDARYLPKATKAHDIIFMDAPYNKNLTLPTITNLIKNGWCHQNTLLIVETARDEALEAPAELDLIDERIYGAARVSFFHLDITLKKETSSLLNKSISTLVALLFLTTPALGDTSYKSPEEVITPKIAQNKILNINFPSCAGIGNRLKKTISYLRYYHPKHLNLFWPSDGWVSARFQDLFIADWSISITEFNDPFLQQFYHPQPLFPIVEEFSLLVTKEDFKTSTPKQINLLYNDTPPELIDIYLPYFKALHPAPAVKARIDEVKLPHNAVAIQVRNAPDWDDSFKGNEPASAFFEVMDTYPEDTIFYLSAMSKEETEPFYARYPDRIVELPNKDYTSMIDAVADMYIIGSTDEALYSIGSTFSEVGWWLGGAKAKVRIIGSKKHWQYKSEPPKLEILERLP